MEQSDNRTLVSILQEDHAIHFKIQRKPLFCVSVMMLKTNVECRIFFLLGFYKHFFSYDGENFVSIASSKCNHDRTLGLANYRGMALTTGSFKGAGCNIRTEIYDFEADQWQDGPDYPFAS